MRRVAREQATAARPRVLGIPARRSLRVDAIAWAAWLAAAMSCAAAYFGFAGLDLVERARRRRQQARVLPGIRYLAEAERRARK